MTTRLPYLLLVPGLLFGIGLAVSGMTNPAKVLGFLDIAGEWDPSLILVMAGAMGSFALLRRLILRRRRPLLGGGFPGPPLPDIDKRLVAGSAAFGVGWGLVGLCPGPAVANLGGGVREAALFVPAMLAGMFVARMRFGSDRDTSVPRSPQRAATLPRASAG